MIDVHQHLISVSFFNVAFVCDHKRNLKYVIAKIKRNKGRRRDGESEEEK